MAEQPDFNNPALWETHDGITVFAEHSRKVKLKNGQEKTISYTKDRLKKIVDRNNARDAKNQPCPLTLGHTIEDEYDDEGRVIYKAKEDEQPDIVGYARQFRLAYDKTLNKWVIRSKYYLKKDRAGEAKKFPRVSVEVWDKGDFFDPIALLKRTPQLDLGNWTYAKGGDIKLRYSMDDLDREPDGDETSLPPPPPEDDGGGDMPPRDDAPDMGPEDVDPDFHGNFMKCIKHYEKGKSKNSMGDAGVGGGGDIPPAKPGMPPRKPAPREEPMRNRRTPEDMRMDRLERTLEDMQTKFAAVASERDDYMLKSRRAECREQAAKALNGKRCDIETEVDILLPMNGKDRDRRLRYLKETLADDIGGKSTKMLRTDTGKLSLSRTGHGDNTDYRVSGGVESGREMEFDDSQLEKATAYMRQNPGCEWDEAEQYARGERAITGEHVGRNGR